MMTKMLQFNFVFLLASIYARYDVAFEVLGRAGANDLLSLEQRKLLEATYKRKQDDQQSLPSLPVSICWCFSFIVNFNCFLVSRQLGHWAGDAACPYTARAAPAAAPQVPPGQAPAPGNG